MTGVIPKAPKLDRIDLKILSTLQNNDRITNAALADDVGLSLSPASSGSNGWRRRATLLGMAHS